MNNTQDFDVVDDLIHFINNNTEFYKEVYYPVVQKFANGQKYNMPLSKSLFVPVAKKGYEVYKQAYNLDDLPEQLSIEDLNDICTKLYDQQIKDIENENSDDDSNPNLQDSVSEEISYIKQLAGINKGTDPYKPYDLAEESNKSASKSEYMKENNIQVGSSEWFKLWFANDGLNMPAGFRGRK